MTIHWCGTGLSAIPGLRRLIELGYPVTVWNRTVEKASAAVGDIASDIRAFDLQAVTDSLAAGDTIVSMLPGDWHVPLAQAAITKRAHFVSSSYISPEMRALDSEAKAAGVALVNEVGLDPGIDHLMAHRLMQEYRQSGVHRADNILSFVSYCGGVPKNPNPFRYKFSWSPLGVLKALKSPSRSLRGFEELNVARPWDAVTEYVAPLPTPESFEVYPNRDSLPFLEDYGFEPDWRVRDFVRGTLRLNGWTEAWRPVFDTLETLDDKTGEATLKEMSDRFWAENAYADGEPDRVVLCVGLKAENETGPVFDQTYVMDAWGDARGSAMARLVSIPVSLAVQAAGSGEIAPGVSAAPSDPAIVQSWLKHIEGLAQHMEVVRGTA